MAKLNSEFNVDKLTSNYTLNVVFTQQFKFRFLMASTLIKAAALVLGCNIKIEHDGEKNEF